MGEVKIAPEKGDFTPTKVHSTSVVDWIIVASEVE
jgi:hypothetical protein